MLRIGQQGLAVLPGSRLPEALRNLGRLLEIFTELRTDSQLVVVTHQRRTMEIADALYGVTMRGDGVTTVISQRLRGAAGASGDRLPIFSGTSHSGRSLYTGRRPFCVPRRGSAACVSEVDPV